MIGAFRFRIVFETKVQIPDEAGGFTESWQMAAAVYGGIEFIRGGEKLSGGQMVSARTLQIRIRFREDIDPAQRLRLGSDVFAIDWVHDPDGKRHWLLIGCTESLPS